MKTRISVLCAAALLTFTSVQAQRPTAQIRGGLNLANISVNDDGDVSKSNQLASYQIGIVGDIPLVGMLHLQPGVIYTGKGAKVERGNEGAANYYKATTSPKYVEIPATAVLKIPIGANSSFNAGFGPYLGIGVGGKRKLETAFGSAESEIKFSDDDPTTFNNEEGTGFGVMRRFDYGFNTSVGLEGKSLVLSANYGYGLAKLQSGTNNNADNNNKHRVLSFTLGFKL
ncbi:MULTISPECIES: outer membrane beta-barrel protein [Chitinophagaceae]|uniref:outer membrane beta-barrel protein n=1 Tax=Chitinophagaceae TaxID=563835 RepID=UPI000DEF4AED|nr:MULTISPECIES: outer membrane beta-barrel protein [Chitinophagaceae]RPD51732.1 hypothetical protein DRJ53_03370 [Paracnuella aquatica]